ncbi:uncharacterized protein [Clytia hemisphaerica]
MDTDFVPLISSYLKSEEFDPCSFQQQLNLPNAGGYNNSTASGGGGGGGGSGVINQDQFVGYNNYASESPEYPYNNSPYNNKNGAIEMQSGHLSPRTHGIINNFPVELEYIRFPEKLFKTQKRIRGKSEQRIQKSILEFALDFLDPVTLNLVVVHSIQVYIKRSKELKNTPKYVGAIQLQPKSITPVDGTFKYLIKVDLDSVYEVDGKKVYQLQKTATEELNLFHLVIQICLADGRSTCLQTKELLLVGKKTAAAEASCFVPSPPTGLAALEQRRDSFSSGEVHSPSGSSGYGTTGDEDVIHASTIVANHIKTKSLEVGNIVIGNTIQTHQGDIAYHFPIQDCDEFFKEGEVIGLFHCTKENKMMIKKLTAATAPSASLKGVITRSQYLEAMKPKDPNVMTETICMLGIVPVKVLGKVNANDPLYASKSEPGVAVSGYHSQTHDISDDSLIGYAFEDHDAAHQHQIGFVNAGVSVLNTASHILLNKRIKKLENHWDRRIRELTRANTNFKRCFVTSGLTFFFLSLLTGFFLWQLLTPGTAYRYWKCRDGSIPDHQATFKYNPDRFSFSLEDVNGIEFDFKKLMKKTEHSQYPMMDSKAYPGVRYYLNVDVCAYGGTRSTQDITTGQKVVYGPDVFAVDKDCKKAFYFVEWEFKWRQIYSSRFVNFTHTIHNPLNLTCVS